MTKLSDQEDGGISGWISVLATWMLYAVWTIVVKGLAVMLPTLQEQFGTTTSLIGWVVATTGTAMGFACKLYYSEHALQVIRLCP